MPGTLPFQIENNRNYCRKYYFVFYVMRYEGWGMLEVDYSNAFITGILCVYTHYCVGFSMVQSLH